MEKANWATCGSHRPLRPPCPPSPRPCNGKGAGVTHKSSSSRARPLDGGPLQWVGGLDFWNRWKNRPQNAFFQTAFCRIIAILCSSRILPGTQGSCFPSLEWAFVWIRFGRDYPIVPPFQGSGLGAALPQVPLRCTWGYSWCHLYEVGVALRSFGPSGRLPESPPCPSRQTRQLKKPTGQTARLLTISFIKTTTLQKISVHLCPSVVKK